MGKTLTLSVFTVNGFYFVAAIVLRNNAQVDLDLIFWQFEQTSFILVLLLGFVLGALAGLLASSAWLYRLQSKYRRLSKQYNKHLG